eukprot:m.350929 g.350929  ORF g.350929 m.350929 type:complete len:99 (-) comp20695_c0_seq4:381-677(-)
MKNYCEIVTISACCCPDDNFMPHWSDKNSTDSARTALFGVYAPARYGDLRNKYYANEAQHRRARGSAAIEGKANKYATPLVPLCPRLSGNDHSSTVAL